MNCMGLEKVACLWPYYLSDGKQKVKFRSVTTTWLDTLHKEVGRAFSWDFHFPRPYKHFDFLHNRIYTCNFADKREQVNIPNWFDSNRMLVHFRLDSGLNTVRSLSIQIS